MSDRQKGDIKIYNYRPITLLNIAHKIFAILLNKTLSVIVEKKNLEVSNGILPK